MQKDNVQETKFDWLSFSVRQLSILALGTWWVIERMRRQDSIGSIVIAVAIGLFLTVLNYLRARNALLSKSGEK
jgi:hypothetical protein